MYGKQDSIESHDINMTINYRQSQFELFPQAVGNYEKNIRPSHAFSSLTLSLENTIIIAIILIMAVIFSFSVGVEKGKKIVTTQPNTFKQDNAELTGHKDKPSNRIKPFLKESSQVSTEQAAVKKAPQATKEILVKNAYTIQVASYKQEKYAQKEAGTLKKTGHQTFVLPKGSHSIVCVGKFSSQAEAKNALSRLRNKYKDCLVRRL